jgi:hypothetical protein
MTLARPGTLMETKLRIVKKDRSVRKPHRNYIAQDIPTLRIAPSVVFVEKRVTPPSKFAAIDELYVDNYGGIDPSIYRSYGTYVKTYWFLNAISFRKVITKVSKIVDADSDF